MPAVHEQHPAAMKQMDDLPGQCRRDARERCLLDRSARRRPVVADPRRIAAIADREAAASHTSTKMTNQGCLAIGHGAFRRLRKEHLTHSVVLELGPASSKTLCYVHRRCKLTVYFGDRLLQTGQNPAICYCQALLTDSLAVQFLLFSVH